MIQIPKQVGVLFAPTNSLLMRVYCLSEATEKVTTYLCPNSFLPSQSTWKSPRCEERFGWLQQMTYWKEVVVVSNENCDAALHNVFERDPIASFLEHWVPKNCWWFADLETSISASLEEESATLLKIEETFGCSVGMSEASPDLWWDRWERDHPNSS